MWYPSQQQQQQQGWHRYIQQSTPPPSTQQQQHHQRTYTRTSYYYNSSASDESPTTHLLTTYSVPKPEMSQPYVHQQAIPNNDVVYETSQANYYAAVSSEPSGDELSSSAPSQANNPHWNPTIAAPRRSSTIVPRSSPSPSAACWDWLLYSPELDPHLHTPSSSFVQSMKQHEDDRDLLLCLPSWLLVLLSPSSQRIRSTDDENETEQEMTSLQHYSPDEPFLSMMHVDNGSSPSIRTDSLSSQPALYSQMPEEKNRSSTPDTDDGYQSASDASRSDYSQQLSVPYEPLMSRKDPTRVTGPAASMAHRISYAAAVKPISSVPNSLAAVSGVKGKPNNDSAANVNGQKLKFIAPRFERMHHAKQYLPSTTMTSQSRSNNLLVQRQPMIQSSRRR